MAADLVRYATELGLAAAALPVSAACGYLGLLTCLSGRRAAGPEAAPAADRAPLRFAVVVPAHDEEAGISQTVRSLRAMDYPCSAFHVLVVADNCSDRTAAAAAQAGAEVRVREDRERRGKGYALRHAYDRLLQEGRSDAVLVVDADTIVSPNLLRAVAARLGAGARAVQAHYAVRNAEACWRTRLLAVAFGAMHGVRSRARERLGLSCGLRGNGMAFSTDLLRAVPHQAWSVVEDLEYGIQLGIAGERVHYVEEAQVLGEMAGSERASRSQRRRWEEGRRAIARIHGWPLLWRGLRGRDPVLLDLGVDLLVPPLATLAAWSAAGLLACAAAAALGVPTPVAGWLFAGSLVALGAHVLRGWALSGVGWRGLVDLLLAPAYVVWKLALRLMPRDHRAGQWVRTRRSGEE